MMRLAVLATLCAMGNSMAATLNFDADIVGKPPSGWTCGTTGSGTPRWTVETDATAPSKGNVLRQSGHGTFPWCVRPDAQVADGFVEVKFKPVSGREDQAGGLVWRWKDADRYYVARANALEGNVSLYYTERGTRRTIRYVDAPVAKATWHTLRVDFAGTHITVHLDNVRYIELDDDHIAGAGALGVWTKADSITAFDDFGFGAATK
jgi:hypothetical protein